MRFLGYFEQICSIPHCSFQAQKLGEFLLEFSKSRGFDTKIDENFNIHAIKGKPKICLQAHYDMVCVGEAPKIELENNGEFISAKNSTLGADNGIGLAIIMEMMDECEDLEVLFTSDEEVGLIGANAFDGEIISPALLNLDSEDESEVIIGCAGGLLAQFEREFKLSELSALCGSSDSSFNDSCLGKNSPKNSSFDDSSSSFCYYELSCEGLAGGHSGMQIAKNIPNAIKELAHFAKEHSAKIIVLSGGDRDNAIPTWAKALVFSQNKLESTGLVSAKKLDILGAKELFATLCAVDKEQIFNLGNSKDNLANSRADLENSSLENSRIPYNADLLNDFLLCLPHGVLGWDESLALPKTSSNLAIVRSKLGGDEQNPLVSFCVQIYARSSSECELERMRTSLKALADMAGFTSSFGASSMPWEPVQSEFASRVLKALQKYRPDAKITAIHAGLECGTLSAKMRAKGKNLVACSIGPNISGAHTINERCEIKSAKIIAEVVRDVLKNA